MKILASLMIDDFELLFWNLEKETKEKLRGTQLIKKIIICSKIERSKFEAV